MSQEMCDQIARSHPLKRAGTPQDIAEATLFLASDASSWITGSTIDVNGGRIMV
jgi:3-oxoacyl-[acyl-carrier protein] reductase